jgi:hypothetical protein
MSQDLLDGEYSSILGYLITLSARASTFGGIVRPICFAALRLMINSNFVGCSIGRPATFRPALQINPDAKVLIEALSGRWSYEQDRRDKRTAWFYVANAFSLLVATIAPMPSNEQIKVISNYDR